ncbi:hypothetical protein FOG51_02359 [Hanseniaspora uvarum]|nr:hypothetical protein FOG48_03877 [Hanseniaspora uvarum]KAF0272635.1 hypothetical protein FOG51_02359 [Hanseniaspora uvarum]KAF0278008.1 hypothetical protein FOG50_01152 [Hanseniaspora uvarum]GMM40298.1 hypothetical protein DAHU10_011990 [Hanseniaspora uvarum]
MASSSSVSKQTTATNLVSTNNVAASSVTSTYTKSSVTSTASESSVSTTAESSSASASSSASSTKSKNAGSAVSAGVNVNWKLSLLVTGLMALGFVSGN